MYRNAESCRADIVLDIVEPRIRIKFQGSDWIGSISYSYTKSITEVFPNILKMLRCSVDGIANLSVLVSLPWCLNNLRIVNFGGSGFLVGSSLCELERMISIDYEKALFNIAQDFDFCLMSISSRELEFVNRAKDKWFFARRGYVFLGNKSKNICWYGVGCDLESVIKIFADNPSFFLDTHYRNAWANRSNGSWLTSSVTKFKLGEEVRDFSDFQPEIASGSQCGKVAFPPSQRLTDACLKSQIESLFIFDPEHSQDLVVQRIVTCFSSIW